MKARKIFILIMVLVLALSFAACQGTAKDKNIGSADNAQSSDSLLSDISNSDSSKTSKNSADTITPEGLPIVKEPITLKMMIKRTSDQTTVNFQDMLAIQELEKRTGVHIEWIDVPSSALAERRNIAMATGDLPDAFIRCGFPLVDQIKYGEQGEFIALNNLIESYGHNLRRIFKEDPTIEAAITMPDGKIYALPNIVNVSASRITPKTFVNTEWMKKVDVEMPANTDEFYQMLKTFKENDGNGNGQDDEIPLGVNGTTEIL